MTSTEWSEHCSYKSSKMLLKLLPTKGTNVIVGPGYDAGVLDVGNGDVITVHIESHNHPSAVDPYGGAARLELEALYVISFPWGQGL